MIQSKSLYAKPEFACVCTSTPKFLFLLLADPLTPTFFIELPGLLSRVDAGREPLCMEPNLPEAPLWSPDWEPSSSPPTPLPVSALSPVQSNNNIIVHWHYASLPPSPVLFGSLFRPSMLSSSSNPVWCEHIITLLITFRVSLHTTMTSSHDSTKTYVGKNISGLALIWPKFSILKTLLSYT